MFSKRLIITKLNECRLKPTKMYNWLKLERQDLTLMHTN